MIKYKFHFLLTVSGLFLVFLLKAQPNLSLSSKLDPKVEQKLWGGKQDIFIILKSKADISNVKKIRGKENKTKFVYERLMATANTEQKTIAAFLHKKNVPHRPFYIVNGIALRADAELILQLLEFSEVKTIMADGLFMMPEVKEEKQEERTVEWGINRINARQVWAQGFTGQGVTIGGQDTGYEWTHDQLQNKYRGWNGTSANHDYNWHDAIHVENPMTTPGNPCGYSLSAPCDDHNHGTHTMRTMV